MKARLVFGVKSATRRQTRDTKMEQQKTAPGKKYIKTSRKSELATKVKRKPHMALKHKSLISKFEATSIEAKAEKLVQKTMDTVRVRSQGPPRLHI